MIYTWSNYFSLVYISLGIYWPPIKSLRFTKYGNEVSDGEIPLWSGTISPQASGGAPSDLPYTTVVIDKITTKQYVKLRAYIDREKHRPCIATCS